jgi:hypothetical protein
MRPQQYTLKASGVHARAHRLLRNVLEPEEPRRVSPFLAVVASVLILAACSQTSLTGACQLVRDKPSHGRVRHVLYACLPPRPRDLLAQLRAALWETLPPELFGQPVVMVLDTHQRPFYGRKNTRGTVRRKQKAGTRKAFLYGTLAALTESGARYNIGLLPVRPHMRLTTLVEQLLGQAWEIGLKVYYLMLDKEFYCAEVVQFLQRKSIPFLMPARKKGGEVRARGEAKDNKAKRKTKPENAANTKAKPQTEGKAKAKPETEGKAKAKPETEGKAKAKPENDANTKAKPENEGKADGTPKPRKGNAHFFELTTPVGWYSYRWTTSLRRLDFKTGKHNRKGRLTVEVQICVARNKKGEPLVYAAWGLGKAWSPAQVVVAYRRRFGIEVQYRQMNQGLARTTSRGERLRMLLVGLALLLCNLWNYVHSEILSAGPRGKRPRRLGQLRLVQMLTAIADHVACVFGGRINEWQAQRPIPKEFVTLET